MSDSQFFSFPTVDALINRYNTDPAFATAIGDAFEGITTAAQLRAVLDTAYDNVDEPVLEQLTVALAQPFALSGVAIPSLGLQALMVAVYCKGTDLVTRYKLGSGGFLDLIRTPDSSACHLPG